MDFDIFDHMFRLKEAFQEFVANTIQYFHKEFPVIF